mmetsp:Transcript_20333/g.63828  ORF Transcript_20333/g.63828 Transcript_20333/m.63828 type:complete len:261 (+) Transcript_20333:361-1143(+)
MHTARRLRAHSLTARPLPVEQFRGWRLSLARVGELGQEDAPAADAPGRRGRVHLVPLADGGLCVDPCQFKEQRLRGFDSVGPAAPRLERRVLQRPAKGEGDCPRGVRVLPVELLQAERCLLRAHPSRQKVDAGDSRRDSPPQDAGGVGGDVRHRVVVENGVESRHHHGWLEQHGLGDHLRVVQCAHHMGEDTLSLKGRPLDGVVAWSQRHLGLHDRNQAVLLTWEEWVGGNAWRVAGGRRATGVGGRGVTSRLLWLQIRD